MIKNPGMTKSQRDRITAAWKAVYGNAKATISQKERILNADRESRIRAIEFAQGRGPAAIYADANPCY